MKRARQLIGAPRRRCALLATTALVLAAGCAKSSTAGDDRASSTVTFTSAPTSPATPGAKVWIAVFAVADDPSSLDGETAQLSPMLGSAIRVSPVQCFHGLPRTVGTGYVIGAVADTRAQLDALVAHTGETAMFEKEVGEFCLD